MNGRYDQSPQLGFTGSVMGGLPSTLDNINPSYYWQIEQFLREKGGRLTSYAGVVLYDTVRVDAGVLPARDFNFFSNAVGNQQGVFVAGTNYTKQQIDVHPWIVQGGTLGLGYEALIWEIGVQFHIVSALDESLAVGNALNLTLDPGAITAEAATDPVKMGNLMRAFQEGLFFEFFLNSTGFESGPGWRFPAGPYGQSGYASMCSGATAPAFAVTDGAANNGFGAAYQMPVMRHIPALTRFGVKMTVQNPFTTANVGTVRIVVTLAGIGLQPVTG